MFLLRMSRAVVVVRRPVFLVCVVRRHAAPLISRRRHRSRPADDSDSGLSSSPDTWKTTVARYRDRYECHVLTLAGFVGQPPNAEPLVATVRVELAKYIRDKQLDRPFIVGHSLGDRSTWCRFLAALPWEHNRATKPNHESQRCVRNERDDR
jgi:hypothetical protein